MSFDGVGGIVTDFHVLTKVGDASREVERVLDEVGIDGRSGLHRFFYVTRADQTVVMTWDATSPLAVLLRGRDGWREPG